MPIIRYAIVCGIGLFLLAGVAVTADNTGRIYGKITTVDDEVLEGLIRWDKNEASWVDILDGTKEFRWREYRADDERKRRKYRDRRRRVRLWGVDVYVSGDDDWDYPSSAQSGLAFGHIQSMEIIGDDEVLLTLKSGEELELSGGSTDIGTGIREIVIEDINSGELELVWDDIDMIEFMASRSRDESVFGERLYGTMTTRRGWTFTGWVCWDVDELFETDVLDGEERRRTRRIKFGKIASIERYSSSGATVILKSGEELILRGTNDVDDGNRGVSIFDPDLGQVTAEWDEFERLDFQDPPGAPGYDAFDGGRLLTGTVYTDDGEAYAGTIRWDNDEEYTWELLNGDYRDMEFKIEFGKIATIERRSSRGAVVTLGDGREIVLRGSNDVDDNNKGIFVTTDDGEEIVVDWDELERVEFSAN
jgi:hypothetical protein